MAWQVRCLVALGLLLAGTLIPAVDALAAEGDEVSAERGAYLLRAANCLSCHTDGEDGEALAGGRALASPFGTFHTPNITPDPDNGIGTWEFEEFDRALRQGRRPDGAPYYPSFPYTSYTRMSDRDLADLWAYLKTVEPVAKENRPHDLAFPFSFRWGVLLWQWLYFTEGRHTPPQGLSPVAERGAYLAEALGHCAECHTTRNRFGAVIDERAYAGTLSGPDGRRVPNITPHEGSKVSNWSESEIAAYLDSGFTPDFDFAGGAMAEVIRDSTSHLSDEDRRALAAYLKSLPPRPGP